MSSGPRAGTSALNIYRGSDNIYLAIHIWIGYNLNDTQKRKLIEALKKLRAAIAEIQEVVTAL